jgi:hypothetical protein
VSKLIFLTGFSGSGKSEAAKKYCGTVYRIDGDHLFSTSLLELRPDLDSACKNDWDQWPANGRNEETVARIFSLTLERASKGIRDHSGHVIADGAIFVYNWFRDPLRGALAAMGHAFEDTDVHLIYANLADEELFINIQDRARSGCGRAHELRDYTDVATVARCNAGFQKKFGASRSLWAEVTSLHDLNVKLGILLSG